MGNDKRYLIQISALTLLLVGSSVQASAAGQPTTQSGDSLQRLTSLADSTGKIDPGKIIKADDGTDHQNADKNGAHVHHNHENVGPIQQTVMDSYYNV